MAALSWTNTEYHVVKHRKMSQMLSTDVSECQQIYIKHFYFQLLQNRSWC